MLVLLLKKFIKKLLTYSFYDSIIEKLYEQLVKFKQSIHSHPEPYGMQKGLYF